MASTVTKTATLVPSGYESLTGMSINASYPIGNGYTNAESTNYTRFDVTASTTGSVYFTFDVSSIPAGATVTGVSARGKAKVSSTTRITNTVMQLYSNTTAKGDNTTFASTTASTQSLTVGSWTRSELTNLRLKIGGTASSSNSSKRIDFYGADVTVTYTVPAYTVTASGDGTIDPASATVEGGGSCEIRISEITNPTVTDNSTDVTSQLEETTEVTATGVPDGNTITGFTTSTISNAYTDADSDTYADLNLAGQTTGTLYLTIDGPTIPAGATITGVEAEATLQFVPGSSTSGFTASCQMYNGSTAMGSATTVASGSTAVAKTKFTLTAGTWTAADIANAQFYLTATNSASSTARHLYVYGVSFKVTYESDDVIYIYTITSIAADHVIVVTEPAPPVPSVPPVITIGTPTRSIISDETGFDQCVCTFTCDQDLQQWEVRATKVGTSPGRGIGLLVESGSTLATGATATIYIDDTELTQGDGEYTISVYGQNTDGVWSGEWVLFIPSGSDGLITADPMQFFVVKEAES